jgi:hypothetical protein
MLEKKEAMTLHKNKTSFIQHLRLLHFMIICVDKLDKALFAGSAHLC